MRVNNVPTPAQMKELLRQAHPADRAKLEKEVVSLKQQAMKDAALNTVKAAKEAAKGVIAQANKAVASTNNHVNELNAEVERLTRAMAAMQIGLRCVRE